MSNPTFEDFEKLVKTNPDLIKDYAQMHDSTVKDPHTDVKTEPKLFRDSTFLDNLYAVRAFFEAHPEVVKSFTAEDTKLAETKHVVDVSDNTVDL